MRDLPRIILSLIFVSAGCTSTPTQPESQAAEVARLEREWDTSSDVPTYERLLADDFIGQWADGTVSNKEETIEDIRSGHDKYEEAKSGEMSVRIYGETAVVTGTFYEKSTLGKNDGTGTYRYTNVWVRRKDSWQMVTFQSLRLSTN